MGVAAVHDPHHGGAFHPLLVQPEIHAHRPQLVAIGGNENCAKLSGINSERRQAVRLVHRQRLLLRRGVGDRGCPELDSALPTAGRGQEKEMNAIAAVVIAATSMKGGEGSSWVR
jgi:ribose transport system permease protein